MTLIGCTMMCEQADPKQLLRTVTSDAAAPGERGLSRQTHSG